MSTPGKDSESHIELFRRRRQDKMSTPNKDILDALFAAGDDVFVSKQGSHLVFSLTRPDKPHVHINKHTTDRLRKLREANSL